MAKKSANDPIKAFERLADDSRLEGEEREAKQAWRDELTGQFLEGNTLWRHYSTGRPPKYSDPETLWAGCVEYFEWAHANPLWETKSFHNNGSIVRDVIPKMRAFTLDEMCNHLQIGNTTWHNYRKKPDFVEVTTRAERIIRVQKFTGAAADLLNSNIIARDLGLKDKTQNEISGPDGEPIKTDNQTTLTAAEQLSKDADLVAEALNADTAAAANPDSAPGSDGPIKSSS